jgi:hypothetical protein
MPVARDAPAGSGGENDRTTIDYTQLIKRIILPAGASAPRRLVHGDVVATAITRGDNADDVRGINASLALIRQTRGGSWPTEPVTEEHNYMDLVWHELEFREGFSFTYVLRDSAGGYLGCAYLYPVGTRTPLSEQLLACDVDVSWWVTPDAYAAGLYTMVHEALGHWLATEFPFWTPHFSNAEIPPT